MKKLLKSLLIVGLAAFSATACKHQAKDEAVSLTDNAAVSNDKIIKDVFTDEYGDQIEVAINETKNTAIVRLDGKSYELKKSEDLPEYTAGDADYQYSDVKGDVTFLKKDYNMVLFHHKKDKSSGNTKMASY
ncbi:hypothetical protein [Chryseobacterium sp. MMS23-Vi53]|uniref:hypothetical protein n=1 Tax=Chryseobacterium sp. MMS23-Vi53 TaxID=3386644 RepID=UPI0039ED16A2